MTSDAGAGILRLLHWEVVVTSLQRTLAFYEGLTPFRHTAVVATPREMSSILVLPSSAGTTPRLRLVQPLDPPPHGAPHDSLGASGFVRIVMHVSDLDHARLNAERRGVRPVAATTGDDFEFELRSTGRRSYRVWACLDPDGIVVEFLEGPRPALSTVASGTADLVAARRFLTGVLGLVLTDTVRTPNPVPNVYLPHGTPVDFVGEFFRVAADPRGYLDVLEHADHGLRRAPYASDTNVGIARCAVEVEDLARAMGVLQRAGLEIGDAEQIDFGADLRVRRTLSFRDPEGVGYRFVEAAG